jgi:Tfp pilus assembly protein FimV
MDNMRSNEIDPDELRHALHAINNSLHVLCLQAELARLHLENGHAEEARAALDRALKERNNCGQALRGLQQLVHSLKL